MTNKSITDDEFNQFRSLPVKKKVDSMTAYLIGDNGHKYNMQEVGAMVFGADNYSFTVSLIHRCYNFSGQNGGKYRNGCKFEKTYGYRVTRNDIEDFVRTYPNGTFAQGITFEDFLKKRVSVAKSATSGVQRQSAPRSPQINRPQTQQYVQPQYTTQNENNSDDMAMMKPFFFGIGSVSLLVLVILLITGGISRHRIISLIALIITFWAFTMLKEVSKRCK